MESELQAQAVVEGVLGLMIPIRVCSRSNTRPTAAFIAFLLLRIPKPRQKLDLTMIMVPSGRY